MGWQGLQELLKKSDRFHIRILARPSKKNRKKLAPYLDNPDLSIIWGDLLDPESIGMKSKTQAALRISSGRLRSFFI